jgi:Chitobiase/beta-hexosaminidase C-terminal domain
MRTPPIFPALCVFLAVILLGAMPAARAQAATATPVISLGTGTYPMPQSTTISDGTAGASILWCYTGVGTCTPATAYTGAIYVDPATTETICADATATGDAQSATTCVYYTNAGSAPAATPAISPASGTYPMPLNATIQEGTASASILWCYAASGTCTPTTAYTGAIYVDPATNEVICAAATAAGFKQSATTCVEYRNAATVTATPAITLSSGSYKMPQRTAIFDRTASASILWCSAAAGECTPATAYTGPIFLDPATAETICANATAPNHQQSTAACATYTTGQINFSYAKGQVTISTALENTEIFYTLDGSTATEGSIEYDGPVRAAPSTTINAVAVAMSSNGNQGIAIQNDQTNAANWKTNLACHAPGSATAAQTQCAQTYVNNYTSPDLKYCAASDDNTTASGCQGVQGIPSQVGMSTGLAVPGFGTATNLNFTDAGLYPGSTDYGTQLLWPYNTGSVGCDTCTSLVEDFYIWPGQNAGAVENWELDMNNWVTLATPNVYRGASMQCSINDGSWDYNGQNGGWYKFRNVVSANYDHDCPLPTGTINGALDKFGCNFTVTPNAANSTVEQGMILWFKDNDEQVFVTRARGNTVTGCRRGYAGTTAAAHEAGTAYSGSVHVQYHVTFIPNYTGTCTLRQSASTPAECIFIDYLKVNNVDVFNKDTYGTMTVDGQTVSSLYVDADTISSTYPDRVFDQKQLDVAPDPSYVSAPIQVGEYIDRDNVTASFGVVASQSYTVPW